jgi:hypothetical protein
MKQSGGQGVKEKEQMKKNKKKKWKGLLLISKEYNPEK